jgi:hypothetical protein
VSLEAVGRSESHLQFGCRSLESHRPHVEETHVELQGLGQRIWAKDISTAFFWVVATEIAHLF